MRRMIFGGLLILLLSLGQSGASEPEPVTPPDHVLALAIIKAEPVFPKVEDILAIIHVESFYKEKAHNGKARGLMQVEKGSYSPEKNISQGVTLLKDLYEKYGSRNKAILAYNIGEGNLEKHRLTRRGRNYVNKVNSLSKGYASAYSLTQIEE